MSAGSIAAELNLLKSTDGRTDLYLGRPRLLSWRAQGLPRIATLPRFHVTAALCSFQAAFEVCG